MRLFFSTHINKLDRKGRVSVPSSFRAALLARSGVADHAVPLIIYPSFKIAGVVEGFGADYLERLAAASANQFNAFSEENDDFNTVIFSSSHQLVPDNEGRVVLPQEILETLGSPEQVAFVGMGETFQIWEPEAHKAFKAQAVARVKAAPPKDHSGAAWSMTETVPHISVLLKEVVEALAPKAGASFVDGTFGAGGYSRALLDVAPCKVYGIDRDPSAVARGQELASGYDGRLIILAGCFGDMDQLLADQDVASVDGVALDLGVSSMQIDQAERGFSFQKDGPLDMRMGSSGHSAADLVNSLPEAELADIIFKYGDERHSRRVAKAIVMDRKAQHFTTTLQLADMLRRVVPRSKDGIDPATRTFQALRIAVNDELGEIDRGLAAAERLLAPGGRLAVVSFHSLEDRAVKLFLNERGGSARQPSRHLPFMAAERAPSFKLLAKKPISASAAEMNANPRARSARLRIAERTSAPVWKSEGARS